jgi:hypothetical protein
MKFWVCKESYSFKDNDGNGDITVFVFAGQIFGFSEYGENQGGMWTLPGNFGGAFSPNFLEINLKG